MGFFAFVTELVYKDLKERLPHDLAENLKLGYVTMKTSFTQIYDKTRDAALALLTESPIDPAISDNMPFIENAHDALQDIYSQTSTTPIMEWIHKHAQQQ